MVKCSLFNMDTNCTSLIKLVGYLFHGAHINRHSYRSDPPLGLILDYATDLGYRLLDRNS